MYTLKLNSSFSFYHPPTPFLIHPTQDEANLRMTTTKRKQSIQPSSPSTALLPQEVRRNATRRPPTTRAKSSCAPPPLPPPPPTLGNPDSTPIFTQRYDVVCFRGNAQIYSGTAEHIARAALHKSAVRGVQELRKVSP